MDPVKQYRELGFALFQQAFEPEAVRALSRALDRQVAHQEQRRSGAIKAWVRRVEPKRAQWSARLLSHSGVFRSVHEAFERAWTKQCDRWGVGPDWGGLCCSFREDPEVRQLLLGSSAFRQAQSVCGQELVLFFSHYWTTCPGYEVHADDFRVEGLLGHNFIGLWTALEDITLDNGPLLVLPGSHRSDEQIEPEVLELNAGDVVIWDGRLRHGSGLPRVQGQSRRAIGCHLALRQTDCWPAEAVQAQSAGHWLTSRLRTQSPALSLAWHRENRSQGVYR